VVWIVDDSPLDARRAATTLADLGTCEVFSHGTDMLERLASQGAPELLVLDWQMPYIAGPASARFGS